MHVAEELDLCDKYGWLPLPWQWVEKRTKTSLGMKTWVYISRWTILQICRTILRIWFTWLGCADSASAMWPVSTPSYTPNSGSIAQGSRIALTFWSKVRESKTALWASLGIMSSGALDDRDLFLLPYVSSTEIPSSIFLNDPDGWYNKYKYFI